MIVSKYVRRLDEKAKAAIADALANAEPGAELDGTKIGRDAAAQAVADLISAEPVDALEATTVAAAELEA